jgi:hypothetical protein
MTAMAGHLAGPGRLVLPSSSSVLYAGALFVSSFNILSWIFTDMQSWIFGLGLLYSATPFDSWFHLSLISSSCLFSLAFRYLVRYTDCLFCGHWTAVA